jgi:hypothetical protein
LFSHQLCTKSLLISMLSCYIHVSVYGSYHQAGIHY